jgi:hypothetical protein
MGQPNPARGDQKSTTCRLTTKMHLHRHLAARRYARDSDQRPQNRVLKCRQRLSTGSYQRDAKKFVIALTASGSFSNGACPLLLTVAVRTRGCRCSIFKSVSADRISEIAPRITSVGTRRSASKSSHGSTRSPDTPAREASPMLRSELRSY